MKMFNVSACLMTVLALTGCSTTQPSQYYSLASSVVGAPADRAGQAVAATRNTFAISVQPVTVPRQVDRPQIVLSTPGSTQVVPLNESLWASPLTDEIRNALANDLSAQLGVLDVESGGLPASVPVWKVALDVQRFESTYDEGVVLDATWRLTPVNQARRSVGVCSAQVQVPVGPGMQALVAGHQQALHDVATVIAAQLAGRQISAASDNVQLKACTVNAKGR